MVRGSNRSYSRERVSSDLSRQTGQMHWKCLPASRLTRLPPFIAGIMTSSSRRFAIDCVGGDSLTNEVVDGLSLRLRNFRASMDALFSHFDLLMLPAAPVSRLPADADLSNARQIILRYTTPFSLAGLPGLSLPGEIIGAPFGTGVQIAAAPGADSMLLAFAKATGDHLAA